MADDAQGAESAEGRSLAGQIGGILVDAHRCDIAVA